LLLRSALALKFAAMRFGRDITVTSGSAEQLHLNCRSPALRRMRTRQLRPRVICDAPVT
jgi:hypothetical protein